MYQIYITSTIQVQNPKLTLVVIRLLVVLHVDDAGRRHGGPHHAGRARRRPRHEQLGPSYQVLSRRGCLYKNKIINHTRAFLELNSPFLEGTIEANQGYKMCFAILITNMWHRAVGRVNTRYINKRAQKCTFPTTILHLLSHSNQQQPTTVRYVQSLTDKLSQS